MRVKAAKLAGVSAKGFTLAEVLVTIVIIGVVSALTIIVFNSGAQTQQQKIAYRIALTRAQQAWAALTAGNQLRGLANEFDAVNNAANFNAFETKFKVVRDCNNNNNSDCWVPGELLWSQPTSSAHAFIDSSGMVWTNYNTSVILVDTNGTAGPNKFGRDRFPLNLGSTRISNITATTPYLPNVVQPTQYDFTTPDSNNCPSGNCYYFSWAQ